MIAISHHPLWRQMHSHLSENDVTSPPQTTSSNVQKDTGFEENFLVVGYPDIPTTTEGETYDREVSPSSPQEWNSPLFTLQILELLWCYTLIVTRFCRWPILQPNGHNGEVYLSWLWWNEERWYQTRLVVPYNVLTTSDSVEFFLSEAECCVVVDPQS